MISYKKDSQSFTKKLSEKNTYFQPGFPDFIGNILHSIDENCLVEFLWFNQPENTDIIYKGTLIDVYVSDSIFSKNHPFLLFELNVDGKSVLISSPPIKENTVEYNNLNWNKYYLFDDSINTNVLDPRIRITIFEK